ncbi:MAG TPA: GAF domain-containing protein [Thermoanaerobaculia bacterium]|nr:GAF domain-containing protein [Thermoanaerobaculia bacterium]
MSIPLRSLHRCFQGIIPCAIATCGRDGIPNVTFISQIQYVDETHMAISCQFFNKTKRNLDENPRATVEFWDPVTFDGYRMGLRFVRSEFSGPLFDTMAARIEVIASHTGMAGVFKLRSADVCEVLWLKKIEGFVNDGPPPVVKTEVMDGPMSELRALSLVSARINRARDLDGLLKDVLQAVDEVFRFRHSMVLLYEEKDRLLVTIASHGYGEGGEGAEVKLGEGLIGAVAEKRVPIRLSGVDAMLRYGRAVRERVQAAGGASSLNAEIPLPGLPDAESQLALPLVVEDRLLGVLAIESRDAHACADWHESFLSVLANQIAMGIDRLAEAADEAEASEPCPKRGAEAGPRRQFVYYKNDDCVFVDGEYLIRNVPGKILWKLLRAHESGAREFTNRELRLDPKLGLPGHKDNLESRLILLRKRLEQKCPDVRLVPIRRGRFALEVAGSLALEEREAG